MKVLIINCNRERTPQTLIPIGACCIAAAVDAAGYETSLLDLTFSRLPLCAVRSAVCRLRPDVIGLSIRNLDNCDAVSRHSDLPEIRLIVDTCRRHSGAILVLGGPAVSLAPAPIMRYLCVEYAVVGEGERVFARLLRAFEQRADPSSIPGVVVSRQGGVSAPSVAPLEDILSDMPDVDFSRWLSMRQYRAYDAAYPVQTKRGCQFQCSYCRYSYLEGHHWRLRDPVWVAEEVTRGASSGLRHVEFVDSVFGLPADHAVACCEAVSRRQLDIPLTTMELNPTACIPELMQAMNAAGFTTVAITAESGSDAMLARMQKGFATGDMHRAAQALRGLRARKLWIFLVGMPGEDEGTVRETARFIAGLPAGDMVYVTFGVRVLPGTALRQTLIESGELAADEELLRPFFYFSPLIDAARARRLLEESGFPSLRLVTLHDSTHWLLPSAQRVMAALGMAPPYWRYLAGMNRLRRWLRV